MKVSKTLSSLASAAIPAMLVLTMSAAGATSSQDAGTYASGTSSVQALPWEGALSSLANGLTGNTAKIIAIIAIFVAGVALIFGEDLGLFARRLLMIVIAVGFLVGAGAFIAPFVGGASF
jgi:type IV secretory pathway VirB2 component (pilin)